MSNFVPGLLPREPSHRRFDSLSAPATYRPPAEIDLRSQLLRASNQGASSKCAAYAMAGWLEFNNWKYIGSTEQIDPDPIYKRAKTIDEMPGLEGTSLQAVLQAAQDLDLMSDMAQDSIKEVAYEPEVKQALHRHGVILSAFTATEFWSAAQPDGWMKPDGKAIGGHAVILAGYSEIDGYYSLQNSWGQDIGWQGFERMSPQQFRAEFQYGLVFTF